MNEDLFNLYELTGQESGIIIYNNDDTDINREIIICNWSAADANGLPILLFGGLIWMADRKPEGECFKCRTDDIKNLIHEGDDLLYDANDDIELILDGEPIEAKVWEYDDVIIIAPDNWN